MGLVEDFNAYRSAMNERIMEYCVKYHLGNCKEVGLTQEQVQEAMGIACLIGGTIVIPHLRRAFEYWEELQHV